MALTEGKQKLFNNAYREYMKIIDFIKYCFKGENDKCDDVDDQTVLLGCLIYTDIYFQIILCDIAVSDHKVTNDEKTFIRSFLNCEENVFNMVSGYRNFLRNITVDNYAEIREELVSEFTEIPIFLRLSAEQNLKNTSHMAQKLIKSVEIILNNFMAIDDNNSSEENCVISNELQRLRKFVQKQNIDCSKQSDDADELENLLLELDSLVGLTSVKKEVRETINFIKVNNIRKERGLKIVPISNHMVFTGNPGTGKTTVARLIAKIYKAMGVLSKGQLIETDRSGLVAGYVGQTAEKTTAVVESALGGVLFIDEAYSLSQNNDSNDYGKEAIDRLVKLMEDNRDDLIVIVAGYTQEMKKFININPGLASRFNKYIMFHDYSANEMLEILERLCSENGYVLSMEAKNVAKEIFTENEHNKEFGNARGVRNIFDKALINQASRIVGMDSVDKENLIQIEEIDLPRKI